MPGQSPVHDLTGARGDSESVLHVDPCQDRKAIPQLVETLPPGDKGIAIERDPAHLQCAIECPQ